MRLSYYIFAVLIIAALALYQCETDTTGMDDNKAHLTISLTDAPAAYDSVIIVFSEISAHIDSQWVHMLQDPVRVNLLDWSNGKTFPLAAGDVPAGHYTQIRIKIDSAFVGRDGRLYMMKVPGGSKTGLKLGPQFTINEGLSYNVILDFDACRSVVLTGGHHNLHGFQLKPHIRVLLKAQVGSISGTVLNPEYAPFAYALVDNDTITSTAVNKTSGYFKLAFLPENEYTVIVEDTTGRKFSRDLVPVTIGEDYELGEITLE